MKNKNEKIIWNRQLIINDSLVGQRVSVYNGRRFFSILVREEMVGYLISEFIKTKDFGYSIHVKKLKKKVKK